MSEVKEFVVRCARAMYDIQPAWGIAEAEIQTLKNMHLDFRLEAIQSGDIRYEGRIKKFKLYYLEADTQGTVEGEMASIFCPFCKMEWTFQWNEREKAFVPTKSHPMRHK